VKNVSRGSWYIEERIVESGRVEQSKNRYKYVLFEEDVVNKIPGTMLKRIKMRFDLESYSM
jgi:hypothetical protein